MKLSKICPVCGGDFETPKHRNNKYCSRDCYMNVFVKINVGRKQTKEHIEKLSKTRRGRKLTEKHKSKVGRSDDKHHQWKGENAGYRSIHIWVENKLGKPMVCERCGTTSGTRFHWCSKTHEHKRDLSDWMRLCPKCHSNYDKLNKLRYV